MKVVSVHKPKQSVLRILHDLELVIAAAVCLFPTLLFLIRTNRCLFFLSFLWDVFWDRRALWRKELLFLYFLSKTLRNGFQSLFSISSAILNDGIVLPI
jgi:hypothetical protein